MYLYIYMLQVCLKVEKSEGSCGGRGRQMVTYLASEHHPEMWT